VEVLGVLDSSSTRYSVDGPPTFSLASPCQWPGRLRNRNRALHSHAWGGSAEMQRSFSTTCSLLDLCGVCQLRCVRGWRVKRWFRKDRTTEYFCEFGHPATLQTSPWWVPPGRRRPGGEVPHPRRTACVLGLYGF